MPVHSEPLQLLLTAMHLLQMAAAPHNLSAYLHSLLQLCLQVAHMNPDTPASCSS